MLQITCQILFQKVSISRTSIGIFYIATVTENKTVAEKTMVTRIKIITEKRYCAVMLH
jgi:hypothetical protein